MVLQPFPVVGCEDFLRDSVPWGQLRHGQLVRHGDMNVVFWGEAVEKNSGRGEALRHCPHTMTNRGGRGS